MSPEAAAHKSFLITIRMFAGKRAAHHRTSIGASHVRELCSRAGVAYLTHKVGHFLEQVAQWCGGNGWPPINALVVNYESRMLGGGISRNSCSCASML